MGTNSKIEKAELLLGKCIDIKEKAASLFSIIKRTLKYELETEKKKLDTLLDRIAELERFSLVANLNKGKTEMTKEDCEERFREIFKLKYEYVLLEAQYNSKKKSFEEYFGGINGLL